VKVIYNEESPGEEKFKKQINKTRSRKWKRERK
jgi:hypothetical protein